MSRAAIKLAPRLKELRIHLCQKGESSKGVRDFIEEHYVGLKCANPKFPILIRECSGTSPKIWARYDMGKEQVVSLENLCPDEILTKVQNLSNQCH